MAVIAIDFDDTLMDTHNVAPGNRMGAPTPGTIVYTRRLVNSGHTIVVFTARNVLNQRIYKSVSDWLDYFKIPYHGITNVKLPEFEYYIDNRAIHFDTWPQVYARLTKLEANAKMPS